MKPLGKPLTPEDLAELGIGANLTRGISEPQKENSELHASSPNMRGDDSHTSNAEHVDNQSASQDASSRSTLSNQAQLPPNAPTVTITEGGKEKVIYAGDAEFPEDEVQEEDLKALEFPNPAFLLNVIDKDFRTGYAHLHKWQAEVHEEIGAAKPTSQEPFKYCLCAANGSGKDAFIIAPFCIWFAISKVRSLTIITSASGAQLTAQTETYIKNMAEAVNKHFGTDVFRIRQRYIKCLWSGSEIRLFATDEAGKAEGYHPMTVRSEMCIIVNEAKNVSEEIHTALTRCSGYNYWFEVSTPGEPHGYFYDSFTIDELKWLTRRVTSYDCPNKSKNEIEADRIRWGEDSALFRSSHLALFTSLGGNVIISPELVNNLMKFPVIKVVGKDWHDKVGVDVAAGGDENAVYVRRGNQIKFKEFFRETDTTITADRLHDIFKNHLVLPYEYEHINIDDGHVGHSVTDMLKRRGWININRVLNQSAATQNKRYGNLGAEMWDIVKRIIEERFIDVRQLDDKTRKQLTSRYYKQQQTQGRITLQSKKEAKAEGRPSPDRADAFILTFRGETLDDFIKADVSPAASTSLSASTINGNKVLRSQKEIEDWFYQHQFDNLEKSRPGTAKHCHGSLSTVLGNQRPNITDKYNGN